MVTLVLSQVVDDDDDDTTTTARLDVSWARGMHVASTASLELLRTDGRKEMCKRAIHTHSDFFAQIKKCLHVLVTRHAFRSLCLATTESQNLCTCVVDPAVLTPAMHALLRRSSNIRGGHRRWLAANRRLFPDPAEFNVAKWDTH